MAPASVHVYRSAALRISVCYLVAGLLWILLTDLYLLVAGYQHASGFQAAVSKGSLFVVLSAAIVYWLVSRDYRVILKSISEQSRISEQLRSREAQLQTMADAIPQIVWIADTQGNITHLNQKACDYTGLAVDNLAGWLWENVVHPDDLQSMHRQWTEILRTGVPADLEFRIRRSDGQYRWHIGRQVPSRDAQKRVEMWYGTYTDIEDRKQAESAIRDRETLLGIVTESAQAGLAIANSRFEYRFVNKAYADIFGRPVTAFSGTRISNMRADVWPELRPKLERALSGEHVNYEMQMPGVENDGVVRWYRVFLSPQAGNDNDRSVVGVIVEITDQKNSERVLRDSEQRYRQLVDLLPSAIFIHLDQKILVCNPAFLTIVGAGSEDDVLGRSVLEIIEEGDYQKIHASLDQNSLPGTEPSGIELRITRLDGRTVPVYAVAIRISGTGSSGTLVVLHDLTDSERSLHLLHSVLDSVQDAIITIDEHNAVQSVNPAVDRLFGYAPSELIGQNIVTLMPEPYKTMHAEYISRRGSETRRRFIGTERELSGRRKDGSEFPMLLTVTEFQLEGRTHYTGVIRDITEKKRLESQFHESQKMEAVGRLAGGVAHDFNNLLTVISGYSDLLLAAMPDRDPNRESITAIREAGERAARLTQQLLAFSRRAIIEPRILDLTGLVADSAVLLRRVIGEDIVLTVETASTNARIKADPGQIEQVIMNLIVNARDAMPTGGRLNVSTKLIFIADPKMPVDTGPPQGAYMELSVTDSGHGIPSDILPQIFDPFFTTKAVGKGTGLGLAVAHGVVKQCGGHIFVDSIVGTGTTFRVLFPVTRETAEESPDGVRHASASGIETVLLVEDEDAVRQIARIALESRGFKVLEASSGQAAIQMSHEYLDRIDVLVTDVVMPEISGRQLVDAIRIQRPGLRALYMSGYMDDSIVHHGVVTSRDAFIRKPFTPFTLARKVRNVLETGK